ncbi:MAG: hypothetical protein B6D68_02115 [spirochete symbiont of Stewartia floridana]|nr:MAG: hypothetical protein B6D68_02115 [spirochete symbiont of Stewartia floridana]
MKAQGIAAEMPLAAIPAIGNEPGTGCRIKALERETRPEGLRPYIDFELQKTRAQRLQKLLPLRIG